MQLSIPQYHQQSGSVDCGPTSLRMLLGYYGISATNRELKEQIPMMKGGCYMADMGVVLQNYGFKTILINKNPYIFNAQDKTSINALTRIEKILRSKSSSQESIAACNSFIRYFEIGGYVLPWIPKIEHIRSEIQEKRPLIASYASRYLDENAKGQSSVNLHYCVVSGATDKTITVCDPLIDPKQKSKKTHSIDDFLHSMNVVNGKSIGSGGLLLANKL